MKDEANRILYQRTQNVWSMISVCTLKLLSKHKKRITKCHAIQVYVVVEKIENFSAGWCLCGVGVGVAWRGVPCCTVGSLAGLFGRFGRVSV